MTLRQQATVSILTGESPDTFRRTLQPLEPLRELVREHIVLCQESDPREMDLASLCGYRPIAIPYNVGVQEGLGLAVEKSISERYWS